MFMPGDWIERQGSIWETVTPVFFFLSLTLAMQGVRLSLVEWQHQQGMRLSLVG